MWKTSENLKCNKYIIKPNDGLSLTVILSYITNHEINIEMVKIDLKI